MLKFRLDDGGFCHILGGGWDSMSTDQAVYALVSYWRLENGMRSLYDMRNNWTADERLAIDLAMDAINDLPVPSADDFKAQLKLALATFRAVPDSEKRYVSNYNVLASSIELAGGEEALDSANPYITSITVTKEPLI